MAIVYRQIRPDDWIQIAKAYVDQDMGDRFPNPILCSGIVAEDDGRIVGFIVLQPTIHMEPLYIDPNYRGRVYIPRLISEAERLLPKGTQYCWGASPVTERIVKRFPATRVAPQDEIFIREVV